MCTLDQEAIMMRMFELNLNIKDLARRAYMSPQSMGRMLKTGHKLQTKTVVRLAKALDLEPQRIVIST